MYDTKALVARLRSDLPVCPYDRRSPDYWTTPNDKPCVVCGGEPEGPDKCRGLCASDLGDSATGCCSAQQIWQEGG